MDGSVVADRGGVDRLGLDHPCANAKRMHRMNPREAQERSPASVQTKDPQARHARARRATADRTDTAPQADVVGGYDDGGGVRWLVLVCRTGAKRWEVCEVAEHEERRVIDELSGEGESRGSALALARDYLQQQRRRSRR
jgi:hypothetical protein